MGEDELVALGLNSEIRDRLLEGITVPDEEDGCWPWTKGHLQCGPKSRPCIWFKGKPFLAYRVMMALVARKHVKKDLNWILHRCPGGENCKCMNVGHHKEAMTKTSGPRENGGDRALYGTSKGERNPAHMRPETRPRGRNHPKSKYRGPEGELLIKRLRATYDAYLDKEGVIAALSRWTEEQGNKISATSIGKLVRRKIHTDVPDDPAAALDPSVLHIQKRSESASKRKHWASGDNCKQTRVPLAAKQAFVSIFHRTPKRAEKRKLVEYVAQRYGVSYTTAQTLGYVAPTTFGAPPVAAIQSMAPIKFVTPEFLEASFRNIPPIQPETEK